MLKKIKIRSISSCILALFVLESCSNSVDSQSASLNKDTIIVYKHDTISDCLPYASIGSIYGGKITKGRLLHTSGLKLLNNNGNYSIISFKCTNEVFKNFDPAFAVINTGPFFNNKTIQLFQRLEANATLSIENIKAFNKNNDTMVLNSIIVHIPG